MVSKNEILDYVMNTPKNTNRAVLSSLIDNLESAGGPAGNIVNITNNSSGTPVISGSGLITADGIMGVQDFPTYIPSGNSKMFLFNVCTGNSETETGMEYTISIMIAAESDAYNVVLNNTPITYRHESYAFMNASTTGPITGQTYNLVITDKE